MFYKDNIKFTGEHARIMKKYTQRTSDQFCNFQLKDEDGNSFIYSLFATNIEFFCVAALVGVIADKKSLKESQTNTETVIMVPQLMDNKELLLDIFRHIYLKDKNEIQIDQKIKDVFGTKDDKLSDLFDQELFNSYVRGGLEIIDENFRECIELQDVYNKIMDFSLEFLEINN